MEKTLVYAKGFARGYSHDTPSNVLKCLDNISEIRYHHNRHVIVRPHGEIRFSLKGRTLEIKAIGYTPKGNIVNHRITKEISDDYSPSWALEKAKSQIEQEIANREMEFREKRSRLKLVRAVKAINKCSKDKENPSIEGIMKRFHQEYGDFIIAS